MDEPGCVFVIPKSGLCCTCVTALPSNENTFPVTGPLCGEFTGHRWIPHTKASDAERWCFLWSALWINGWLNNHEAGDLKCQRAHYDVIVMIQLYIYIWPLYNDIVSHKVRGKIYGIVFKRWPVRTLNIVWECVLIIIYKTSPGIEQHPGDIVRNRMYSESR